MFVILSVALILSAAVVITPFSPLFVIIVALIVPLVLSKLPVLVMTSELIEPLFVNVPLLSTSPVKVVALDNVVVPLFVKSAVTSPLNSASAAVAPANLSISIES